MTDAQQANGNQPESQNQAEATAQPHNKRVTKWVAIVIAIVAVAIIAAVAVFGTRAYSASQYDSAVAACAAASEDVRNATNDYNNLVNGDAAEAAALTKADVSDASALDALSKELTVEPPTYEGCVADDTKGYQAATRKLEQQVTWYHEHTTSLQKAVDAVNAVKK